MNIGFVRFLGINLFIIFIFHKIMNDLKISTSRKFGILLVVFFISFFENFSKDYINTIPLLVFNYFLYSFIIGKLTNINLGYSLMVIIICSSISFFLYFISSFITAIILSFLPNYNYANIIPIIFSFCLELIFIIFLFRMKRLKNGFPFLKNGRNNYYLDMFIFMICITTLFVYFLISNYSNIPFMDSSIIIVMFLLVLFITLYKSFIIYQKQKLLEKTIKDYEQELYEKQTQLETILKEKNNLIKANHEFYHRQKALSLKLDNLMKSKNLLFKEEYGNFVDRIDTLATEYNNVIEDTKISNSIPKTNIPEIDDMFVYMQNECNKNNIEFILKLTCDAYQLINNIIPKNKLETLIGDLIRNSIIAINHSSNEAKAIMVILGIKNNIYEFSVYDTGIEFQIDTLLKLGKECATTHKDSGGTGIGFITTFETLKYCNASLIITEFSDKSFNYTKSVTIKFDNKNDYIIETYRLHDFYKKSNTRNDLIIKPNSSNPNFSHRQVNSLVYK